MKTFAKLLSFLVAIQHFAFLTVEMFLWNHPVGRGMFNLTEQFAAETTALAANQGLYNGFLSAGLIWGLMHPVAEIGTQVQIFFLLCVIAAGIYGGLTAKRSILLVQGLPAMIALSAVLIS